MNVYTLTVTVTTDNPNAEEVAEDVRYLLIDAAGGYIGEPDRPIGGATITTEASS